MKATRKKNHTPLGRSLLRGEVSVDEVRKLTQGFAAARAHFETDPSKWGYDTVLVDGDLTVRGDLDTLQRGLCSLIVRGSLRVSGAYGDYDNPATGVFVLGSMEADRVITSGSLCVAGTLFAKTALVGSGNDFQAWIGGDLKTDAFIPQEHFFDVRGKLDAGVVLGHNAEHRVPRHLKKNAKAVPSEWWVRCVPQILEVYGEEPGSSNIDIKHPVIEQRVLKGLPILRAAAPAPKVKPARTGKQASTAKTWKQLGAQYFQRKGARQSRYWLIARDGNTLRMESGLTGKMGGKGKEKTFDSEAAAKKALARLISEKQEQGYVLQRTSRR